MKLKSLIDTFPGFSILVTGHSLGGALASLCAFQLITEDSIVKPIICITFASPRTRNFPYARAFQELEIQETIVYLRVTNDNDLIILNSDRLNCLTFFCQDKVFRHVGMHLKLYPESSKRARRSELLKPDRVQQPLATALE